MLIGFSAFVMHMHLEPYKSSLCMWLQVTCLLQVSLACIVVLIVAVQIACLPRVRLVVSACTFGLALWLQVFFTYTIAMLLYDGPDAQREDDQVGIRALLLSLHFAHLCPSI